MAVFKVMQSQSPVSLVDEIVIATFETMKKAIAKKEQMERDNKALAHWYTVVCQCANKDFDQ